MKKFNYFITFEGPEGSGKSTIAKMVKEYFENKGKEVLLTREPGGNEFAEEIRNVIMKNSDIDPMTELLLFESARREHLDKKIIPAISNRKLVISDRFMDSSTVYQGIVKGLGRENVEKLNEITVGEYKPSLTIIFDLEPEIGLERINANNRETNKFDKYGLDFHISVRNAYKSIAKDDERFKIVDASQDIDNVFKQTIKIIEEIYND